MRIRALIAEDEPLARRTLWDYLGPVDWIECVGEAADGLEAVRLIDAEEPDLVFLDVKMPELTGLQVLQRIRHRPSIVFTTAFDRYAVTAFELEAVDYLLKPFSRKRFLATLERVRQRLETPDAGTDATDRARGALDASAPLRRVFARKGDRIVPVTIEQVSHFEAAGDYVKVHGASQPCLLHVTLTDLENLLDRRRFRRIHRSHVVNLDHVSSMRPYDDRRIAVTLTDGSEVVASRSGSQALRDMVL